LPARSALSARSALPKQPRFQNNNTTATTSTWASYTTRGLPKRGRCEVGELEQGNDGICLLAVDAGAHVSEPASRPSPSHCTTSQPRKGDATGCRRLGSLPGGVWRLPPSHWHDARVDIIRVAAFSLSAQQVRSPRNKADHRDWPQLKATGGPLGLERVLGGVRRCDVF
jgi:hypothetical protein